MQTMFMELSLNVGVKRSNLATLSILHMQQKYWKWVNFVKDWSEIQCSKKAIVSLVWRMSGVYREFVAKLLEIKVADINMPLNQWCRN